MEECFIAKNGHKIIIRRAYHEEWEDAMAVAWRVFKKYEAPQYPKRGVESFLEFITDNRLRSMFLIGEYNLWVALDNNEIVGVAGTRMKHHLSILFVLGEYHRQGVATNLLKAVFENIVTEQRDDFCTVNAAPYGMPFYEKIGFVPTGKEEISDGMIITPMRKSLKDYNIK